MRQWVMVVWEDACRMHDLRGSVRPTSFSVPRDYCQLSVGMKIGREPLCRCPSRINVREHEMSTASTLTRRLKTDQIARLRPCPSSSHNTPRYATPLLEVRSRFGLIVCSTAATTEGPGPNASRMLIAGRRCQYPLPRWQRGSRARNDPEWLEICSSSGTS